MVLHARSSDIALDEFISQIVHDRWGIEGQAILVKIAHLETAGVGHWSVSRDTLR